MKKLNFSRFLLSNIEKISRNKDPIPIFPKTIIFNGKSLHYLYQNSASIQIKEIQLNELEDFVWDLGQKKENFPFAVMKRNHAEICMRFEDALEKCTKGLDENFELQEYIVPERDFAQVIRVYIKGMNVTAQILENQLKIGPAANENQYRLSNYEASEKMMISFSTFSLKQSANSVFHWISSSFSKKFVLYSLTLDFIKSSNKFFLISIHSHRSSVSSSSNNTAPSLFSPISSPGTQKYSSNTQRIMSNTRRSSKNLAGTAQKKQIVLQKSSETNFQHRGSVNSIKEDRKSTAMALRGLYLNLEESMKKIEKERFTDPNFKSEYEEFLEYETKTNLLPTLRDASDSSTWSKNRLSLKFSK